MKYYFFVLFMPVIIWYQNASVFNVNFSKLNVTSKSIATGTKIDTIYYDSQLVCLTDTCYWSTKTIFDTIATGLYLKDSFDISVAYSLFDPQNDSFSVQLCVGNLDVVVNGGKNFWYGIQCIAYYNLDTIYGDTSTRPGLNKCIYAKFKEGELLNYNNQICAKIIATKICDSFPCLTVSDSICTSFTPQSIANIRLSNNKSFQHHKIIKMFMLNGTVINYPMNLSKNIPIIVEDQYGNYSIQINVKTANMALKH